MEVPPSKRSEHKGGGYVLLVDPNMRLSAHVSAPFGTAEYAGITMDHGELELGLILSHMWMSGMGSRVERPGARVWSSRPPNTPGQLGMIRRGLIGRVRGKTPKGVVCDLCPLIRLFFVVSKQVLAKGITPNLRRITLRRRRVPATGSVPADLRVLFAPGSVQN